MWKQIEDVSDLKHGDKVRGKIQIGAWTEGIVRCQDGLIADCSQGRKLFYINNERKSVLYSFDAHVSDCKVWQED